MDSSKICHVFAVRQPECFHQYDENFYVLETIDIVQPRTRGRMYTFELYVYVLSSSRLIMCSKKPTFIFHVSRRKQRQNMTEVSSYLAHHFLLFIFLGLLWVARQFVSQPSYAPTPSSRGSGRGAPRCAGCSWRCKNERDLVPAKPMSAGFCSLTLLGT